MKELQEIVDWITSYELENEIMPHPNLIKMHMKLRIENLQNEVNIRECIQCGKNEPEMCGSCVCDIAQGSAEQAIGSRKIKQTK
tara:strand:- start:24960 stop:25211 length:252 start_codon:yes stop_codon:yes gene_type:complete